MVLFLKSLAICLVFYVEGIKISEEDLKNYLNNQFEKESSDLCYKSNVAEFDYETDINNKTKEEITINITLEGAKWQKDVWNKYFKGLSPDDFKDPSIKRQIKYLGILGTSILEQEKLGKLTNSTSNMTGIYSTAKICPYNKQNCSLPTEGLSLEPDIEGIMSESTDYDELVYVWSAWRNATGAKMKEVYKIYVDLSNEAARLNNFSDNGELWRNSFEDPDFVTHMDTLWQQVEPLYKELQTYVGRKLKERYGSKLDFSDGLLPAHVFGNMWAQQWSYLSSLAKPFPNVTKPDMDLVLKRNGSTILDLFQTADEFYQSMGLLSNDVCYNETLGAMIRKPNDGRDVLCHASAWDFCDGKNYRIKMCTQVNFEDFITIHHEMGHIQYYQQYKHLPSTFRDGANPGFHEAIGDTIALSVATPKHLRKINLLNNYTDTNEFMINTLMDKALDKIAFLPFGLLIDKWRWDVFSGRVSFDQWNSHWWKYRESYQKIKSPIPRSDAHDFDPGSKFHVAGDSQYISYFFAHILQFQLYKSLCIAAGEYDPANKTQVPLSQCDFYKSTKAGDLLKSGLSLGASKHWRETLKVMTGEENLDAGALLEYFDPLMEFLKHENNKNSFSP